MDQDSDSTSRDDPINVSETVSLTSSLPFLGVKKYKYRTDRQTSVRWTPDEDHKLLKIINEVGAKSWKNIATLHGCNRTDVQCLHRYNKVLRPGLQKGTWTGEEDEILRRAVESHGLKKIKWANIAANLPGRLGKQCRERWFNHLDPSINRNDWTEEENRILYEAQRSIGNRWCEFVKILPGRTENSIKNRWHGKPFRKWLDINKLQYGGEYDINTPLTYDNLCTRIIEFRTRLLIYHINMDYIACMQVFGIDILAADSSIIESNEYIPYKEYMKNSITLLPFEDTTTTTTTTASTSALSSTSSSSSSSSSSIVVRVDEQSMTGITNTNTDTNTNNDTLINDTKPINDNQLNSLNNDVDIPVNTNIMNTITSTIHTNPNKVDNSSMEIMVTTTTTKSIQPESISTHTQISDNATTTYKTSIDLLDPTSITTETTTIQSNSLDMITIQSNNDSNNENNSNDKDKVMSGVKNIPIKDMTIDMTGSNNVDNTVTVAVTESISRNTNNDTTSSTNVATTSINTNINTSNVTTTTTTNESISLDTNNDTNTTSSTNVTTTTTNNNNNNNNNNNSGKSVTNVTTTTTPTITGSPSKAKKKWYEYPQKCFYYHTKELSILLSTWKYCYEGRPILTTTINTIINSISLTMPYYIVTIFPTLPTHLTPSLTSFNLSNIHSGFNFYPNNNNNNNNHLDSMIDDDTNVSEISAPNTSKSNTNTLKNTVISTIKSTKKVSVDLSLPSQYKQKTLKSTPKERNVADNTMKYQSIKQQHSNEYAMLVGTDKRGNMSIIRGTDMFQVYENNNNNNSRIVNTKQNTSSNSSSNSNNYPVMYHPTQVYTSNEKQMSLSNNLNSIHNNASSMTRNTNEIQIDKQNNQGSFLYDSRPLNLSYIDHTKRNNSLLTSDTMNVNIGGPSVNLGGGVNDILPSYTHMTNTTMNSSTSAPITNATSLINNSNYNTTTTSNNSNSNQNNHVRASSVSGGSNMYDIINSSHNTIMNTIGSNNNNNTGTTTTNTNTTDTMNRSTGYPPDSTSHPSYTGYNIYSSLADTKSTHSGNLYHSTNNTNISNTMPIYYHSNDGITYQSYYDTNPLSTHMNSNDIQMHTNTLSRNTSNSTYQTLSRTNTTTSNNSIDLSIPKFPTNNNTNTTAPKPKRRKKATTKETPTNSTTNSTAISDVRDTSISSSSHNQIAQGIVDLASTNIPIDKIISATTTTTITTTTKVKTPLYEQESNTSYQQYSSLSSSSSLFYPTCDNLTPNTLLLLKNQLLSDFPDLSNSNTPRSPRYHFVSQTTPTYHTTPPPTATTTTTTTNIQDNTTSATIALNENNIDIYNNSIKSTYSPTNPYANAVAISATSSNEQYGQIKKKSPPPLPMTRLLNITNIDNVSSGKNDVCNGIAYDSCTNNNITSNTTNSNTQGNTSVSSIGTRKGGFRRPTPLDPYMIYKANLENTMEIQRRNQSNELSEANNNTVITTMNTGGSSSSTSNNNSTSLSSAPSLASLLPERLRPPKLNTLSISLTETSSISKSMFKLDGDVTTHQSSINTTSNSHSHNTTNNDGNKSNYKVNSVSSYREEDYKRLPSFPMTSYDADRNNKYRISPSINNNNNNNMSIYSTQNHLYIQNDNISSHDLNRDSNSNDNNYNYDNTGDNILDDDEKAQSLADMLYFLKTSPTIELVNASTYKKIQRINKKRKKSPIDTTTSSTHTKNSTGNELSVPPQNENSDTYLNDTSSHHTNRTSHSIQTNGTVKTSSSSSSSSSDRSILDIRIESPIISS